MNNIDQILDNLRGQQAEPGNADKLTDSIMNRIDQPSGSRRHITIALVVRTALSAAAIWLIGLLIYQTCIDLNSKNIENKDIAYQIDNLQRIGALRSAYVNCRTISKNKTMSYTQFKKMLYEKQ